MAVEIVRERRTWQADLGDVAWRLAIGLGAGSLVGYVVVGPLARLLMLALRLTSPDAVRGVTSDDGFTIGRFSADTIGLLVICGGITAVAGIAYAGFRMAVPNLRVRIALWTTVSATVAGSRFVKTEGVDFTLLSPTWFAVGGFVALPAVAAICIALLVERWSNVRPGRNRTAAAILAPGLLAPPAIVVAAAASLGLFAVRRLPLPGLARIASVVVPVLAVAAIGAACVDLVSDISTLRSS